MCPPPRSLGGACSSALGGTITHDMNGLCPWRHSARLLSPRPDHRLGHLPKLEMADDAVLTYEEGAREGQHAETPRGRPVAVEDRLQAIEPERVEEGARLVARLHQVDLKHDDVGLAGGDALQRRHLLPAGKAQGPPAITADDLAPASGESERLPIDVGPLEVGCERSDPPGRAVGFDLSANNARVGHGS